jgi:hypothetical protein
VQVGGPPRRAMHDVNITIPDVSPSEHHREPIGYAPALRRDDLLMNAILFRARSMGKRSMKKALAGIATHRGWSQVVMPFARDAPRVALSIYGDVQKTGRVAADFSMLGAYCAAGRRGLYHSLRSEMGVEDASRLCASLVHTRWMRRLTASAYRLCPVCKDGDLSERGFSTWRASHQAPWLGHCTIHGCELLEAPYVFSSRGHGILPGMPHEIKASELLPIEREIAPSDGYAALIRLWHTACFSDPQDVCIENWIALVSAAKTCIGDTAELIKHVERKVSERWDMSLSDVGRMLSLGNRFNVDAEIRLRGRPCDLVTRLITFDALQHMGISALNDSSSEQTELSYAKAQTTNPEYQRLLIQLSEIAQQSGVDERSCRTMLTPVASRYHKMELHIDEVTARKVAALCGDDLLLALWNYLGKPTSHWTSRELRRRGAHVGQRPWGSRRH